MKARFALLGALALVLAAAGAPAQEFWVKKGWKEWNKNDCQKMLEDSPWAQKWETGQAVHHQLGESTGGEGREGSQKFWYIIQFRSALPVRQAFIRKAQFDNKYDKMSEEKKKSFDVQTDGFLSRTYDDVIVVHVLFGSNVQFFEREMMRHWQSFPTGTVPLSATLINSKDERVTPIRYISPPGGQLEFELIFPRRIEGRPFLAPDVKAVRIEFQHPGIRGMPVERVFKEFKIEKMMLNGELIY